jgi:hypothetical protein
MYVYGSARPQSDSSLTTLHSRICLRRRRLHTSPYCCGVELDPFSEKQNRRLRSHELGCSVRPTRLHLAILTTTNTPPSSTVFACVRASSLGLAVSDLSWVYCWAAIWGNIELGFGILGAVSLFVIPWPVPDKRLTNLPQHRTSPCPAPIGNSSNAASTPSPPKPAPQPTTPSQATTTKAAAKAPRTPTPCTSSANPETARTPRTPCLPALSLTTLRSRPPGTAHITNPRKSKFMEGGTAVVRRAMRRTRSRCMVTLMVMEWGMKGMRLVVGLRGRSSLALRQMRGVGVVSPAGRGI